MKTEKDILIGKYLSGNASQKEKNEIMEWIKEDPANEKELAHLKKMWDLSLALKTQKENDTEKAWNDLKFLAEKDKAVEPKKPKYVFLKVAAAISLLAIFTLLVKGFVINKQENITPQIKADLSSQKKEELSQVAMITVLTEDSSKVFFLPDSSRVHLNKNSKFIYPERFNDKERSTSLLGEGFFEIKHNGAEFVVMCKNTKTTVLGTSFNIKGYESDPKLTISVVTGTVQISDDDNNKHLILKANERGTVNDDGSTFTKTNYTDKNFIWWKKNTLKTKIKKIIKKLKQKIN